MKRSIAVLPFINDSPDQENTYFINGVMEEILNNLQKIKDLRVISRMSVEQFRDKKKPVREIAADLGVNYIVEGSGQKYGTAFRLRAQLIMTAKETHLWGQSFQQKITDVEDIFIIQKQIAESIAAELKAVIAPEEKQLIDKIPTTNMAAYEDYLKGRFYLYKATENDLETALHYFKLAKEKDPEFALAYTGIGDVWLFRQQFWLASPDAAGPKLMAAVKRALELDSNLAEAHAFYSHLLNILGRPEEAMEHIELALKLDPHNPTIKVWYSQDLLYMRRYDDCISVCREVFEVMKLYYCNMYKDFNYVFDQYEKLGYAGTLNLEDDTLIVQSKTKYILPFDIAYLYIFAGNKERAMECLEQAYEIHDSNMPYITRPTYDSLRDDPRFQTICRKMNLPCNN